MAGYVMWDLLYSTFLRTTDPSTSYSELIASDVFFSILFHEWIYLAVYVFITRLFELPCHPLLFLAGLTVIMTFGYVGRLARVKGLNHYYVNTAKYDEETARRESQAVLRRAYFSYVFAA